MAYILKRLGSSVVTLLLISTITFFLMHTVPGGPFLGDKRLPDNIIRNLEIKYGLDKPVYVQYIKYMENALKGDLGGSIMFKGRTVSGIIQQHFPVSMRLGLVAIAIAVVLGTLLGIVAAIWNGQAIDRVAMLVATVGIAVPAFVVATLSMIFFGVTLKVLPTYGLTTFRHYILPSFALAFFPLSFIARLMRSSMMDVISQDYIKTARAKGLPERVVIFKHALRNAIMPVVTYMGPLVASILTGSFVVESIFTIPGLGKFFVESISNRDYSVILGVTIFYGAFLIFMNFAVDISYSFIDPRIKVSD